VVKDGTCLLRCRWVLLCAIAVGVETKNLVHAALCCQFLTIAANLTAAVPAAAAAAMAAAVGAAS
jgi:hypothetical protein